MALNQEFVEMSKELVRILIVDDEEDITEFLSYNLKKENYHVLCINDSTKAIATAESFRPDLIVLDIMMPVMNGIEVCRHLRSKSYFADIIIVFLTAIEEDLTQIKALENGGDDFINKPIKPKVFISRINALLRRMNRNENRKEINIGSELIIDRQQMIVKIGKNQFSLPKKEFEILHLLSTRPGEAFSRDEIYSKVWGNEIIVSDRTIDVHIRKLREKLGNEQIITIKGIGYKIKT